MSIIMQLSSEAIFLNFGPAFINCQTLCCYDESSHMYGLVRVITYRLIDKYQTLTNCSTAETDMYRVPNIVKNHPKSLWV